MWQERRSAWEHAGQTSANLVAAINSDIYRNIEQYALSLQGVIDKLRLADIDRVSPEIRKAVLFDKSAGARYLGAIRILNETGKIVEVGNVAADQRGNDGDSFKAYNDTHGHQTGDNLLLAIAICIADKARRASDLSVRYGGDEFALLLPGTSSQGALEIAERIRVSILNLRLRASDGAEPATASVSIGVAAVVPRPESQYSELVDAADKALYEAKAKGRNRSELIELPDVATVSGPRMVA
ncbi:MAG: diguanylate cyclase [Xanthobacteraceae bacterium]